MQNSRLHRSKRTPVQALDRAELLAIIAQQETTLRLQEAELQQQQEQIHCREKAINERDSTIKDREQYILILEEYVRLLKIQKYGSSSEKLPFQADLFDEAELQEALSDLIDQVDDEDLVVPRPKKRRNRGFPKDLPRKRIELLLSEAERAMVNRTFFTKVKEELEYIPAQLNVLEYWQEKGVVESGSDSDGENGQQIIAAQRPAHPLGKCYASTSLLAYIIVAKYADGLPLYRLESILKRYSHGFEISRSNMAHWIVRLSTLFQPLINLMREIQNSGEYLNGDETRIQVLKEDGKTAQSDKWMWVTCGGPPAQESVLFEYDPSRAGAVAVRILDDFSGTLQADGYGGYAKVCRDNGIQRIGCWDHARRKFVEAEKAAESKRKGKSSLASIALSKIRKLYRIEGEIQGKTDEEIYRVRQELSLPILEELKQWLEKRHTSVMKGSKTRTAMEYTLNQWEHLIGYCNHGQLKISNARAENAIRPFAVGRRAWLFSDTPQGARASAICYSLVESAKLNNLEPSTYIEHILNHIAAADTLEKIEVLLPWNVPLPRIEKNREGRKKGR